MDTPLKTLAPYLFTYSDMPPRPSTGTDLLPKTYNDPPLKSAPKGPVLGGSRPLSGSRGDVEPFDFLSPELAMYGFRRTVSIIKGAKAGC